LPGVDLTSVPLHAAPSTADDDADAGGRDVVGVVGEDAFDADRHPARRQSVARSTASDLRVTEARR
jgi:hypothetical protein